MLANRRRLQIFRLLVHERCLTVSAVAQRLKLVLPVASQYLRGLEARGFLEARRVADRVYYGLSAADALRPAQLLVPALRVALRGDSGSVEKVFKLATAFTHPRRIEIFRALERGGRTVGQLRALTGISRFALGRHLAKLEARGFVVGRAGSYAVAKPRDGFGRALARLAGG
jgi:DNA-binding transcriptional ArsR family regulator